MRNKKIHAQLQSELKNFGLNPAEWSLERVQSLSYLVRNKFDKDFSLHGRLEFKQRRPTWKSLELLSL